MSLATQVHHRLYLKVAGTPQTRGSKRPIVNKHTGRAMMVDSCAKSKDWMAQVRHAATEHLAEHFPDWTPIVEPVILSATFYFARPKGHYGTGRNSGIVKASAPQFHSQKPDVSKLVRPIEDALTGIVWRDDCQVYRYLNITKAWTLKSPRVELSIEWTTDPAA